ncbi:MAG: hypothetical protein WD877_00855 [Candidatus Saccharimonadales bacterium]
MPPQQTTNPQSPGPLPSDQYNFILNNQSKPPGRFRLPVPNLPKPAKIILGAVLGLFAFIIIYSIFFGSGGNRQPLADAIGRSTEIVRVTEIAKADLSDTNLALAATTQSVLSSNNSQLTKYASGEATSYLDNSIDAQLASAASNNQLDSTYIAYLVENLTAYDSALAAASQNASEDVRPLLDEARRSIQTILSAPQF